MREKLKGLKKFNWHLFAALCALSVVPAVYQTIKTFIISSNNQWAVFDIIGQMEWFDLINETLQAFLIIPLYSILNKIKKNNENDFAGHTFKTGFITFVVYTAFSIGVLIYGEFLIKAMNTNGTDFNTINRYLQLETIAFIIGILISFVNVVFVVEGKPVDIYIFLGIKTILQLFVDLLFISNLGVYGIALSNIIVNSILAITSCALLYRQGSIRVCRFRKSDLEIIKNWCKTGVFSGTQQFIDNLIYAVMVCKMVNLVAEQGNYWIANNFIWGWLLIPITALSEIIRRDCKDGYLKLRQFNYYFVAGVTIALWVVSIPIWTPFYRYAENLANANEVFLITVKLVPFYISYACCAIIDNIFIGLGKTVYNAINSLIINFIYYGIFYILYRMDKIAFSMNVIIMMFGFGMVVHLAVSITEEKIFRHSQIKHISML